MNKFIRCTAILGCLLLATASFAQGKPTHQQTTVRKAPDKSANGIIFSADKMTRDLGLSPDQSEKLKSIELDMNQRLRDLETLDPKERDPKQAEVRTQYQKMIASVLTPDQNRKLAAITAKAEKDHETEKMRTNNPKQ